MYKFSRTQLLSLPSYNNLIVAVYIEVCIFRAVYSHHKPLSATAVKKHRDIRVRLQCRLQQLRNIAITFVALI
jgi:hypothetical protein